MFGFKAYFYGNDVYINEKYRYNSNEILIAYLNDRRIKYILDSDFVGKLKQFKRPAAMLVLNIVTLKNARTILFGRPITAHIKLTMQGI